MDEFSIIVILQLKKLCKEGVKSKFLELNMNEHERFFMLTLITESWKIHPEILSKISVLRVIGQTVRPCYWKTYPCLAQNSWTIIFRLNALFWMIFPCPKIPKLRRLDVFSSKTVWLMTRFWKKWIGTHKFLTDEFSSSTI